MNDDPGANGSERRRVALRCDGRVNRRPGAYGNVHPTTFDRVQPDPRANRLLHEHAAGCATTHFTRRDALRLLAAGSGALLTGSPHVARAAADAVPASRAASSCIVTPEQTEGPFFVDEKLARSDLRADPSTGRTTPGVPLSLSFRVASIDGSACAAIAGAQVDVWHCDAAGRYSDVGRGAGKDKFLRGYQLTDSDGVARFTTIFPGGYAGRAVHIHFKVRPRAVASPKQYELTSQLYFDDDLTDAVHANPPYAGRNSRALRNADDFIFRDGGRQLLVALTPAPQGYNGSFDIALRIG